MSLGATLVASFLVTLVRPATWILGLAAFLIRGGILVFLAPIIVIPSAVGLANIVAPILTDLVLAGPSPTLFAVGLGVVLAWLLWLVGAGLVAAATEVEAIRIVAADDEVVAATGGPPGRQPPRHIGKPARRVLAVRLLAHLPTTIALSWGAITVVAIAYRELTVPSDVVTPMVLRVIRGAPEAIALIVVTWLGGEAIGSAAARRIVQRGDGMVSALGGAIRAALRHPVRFAGLALLPTLALLAVLVPAIAASAVAWEAVRSSFADGAGFLVSVAWLVAFVSLWAGGLVLTAVVSAWRAAAWTVDAAGTFGSVRDDRPGDYAMGHESATLPDLRPQGIDPDTR